MKEFEYKIKTGDTTKYILDDKKPKPDITFVIKHDECNINKFLNEKGKKS